MLRQNEKCAVTQHVVASVQLRNMSFNKVDYYNSDASAGKMSSTHSNKAIAVSHDLFIY